jgi:hypothetical protein
MGMNNNSSYSGFGSPAQAGGGSGGGGFFSPGQTDSPSTMKVVYLLLDR